MPAAKATWGFPKPVANVYDTLLVCRCHDSMPVEQAHRQNTTFSSFVGQVMMVRSNRQRAGGFFGSCHICLARPTPQAFPLSFLNTSKKLTHMYVCMYIFFTRVFESRWESFV